PHARRALGTTGGFQRTGSLSRQRRVGLPQWPYPRCGWWMDGPVTRTGGYRFSQPQYTEIPDASFCRLIRISLHVTRLVPALAAPPPMLFPETEYWTGGQTCAWED